MSSKEDVMSLKQNKLQFSSKKYKDCVYLWKQNKRFTSKNTCWKSGAENIDKHYVIETANFTAKVVKNPFAEGTAKSFQAFLLHFFSLLAE